jgi:hypothetical protein
MHVLERDISCSLSFPLFCKIAEYSVDVMRHELSELGKAAGSYRRENAITL